MKFTHILQKGVKATCIDLNNKPTTSEMMIDNKCVILGNDKNSSCIKCNDGYLYIVATSDLTSIESKKAELQRLMEELDD